MSGEFTALAENVMPVVKGLEEARFAGLRIVSSTIEIGFIANQGGASRLQDSQLDLENRLRLAGVDGYRAAIARLVSLADRCSPTERVLLADLDVAGDRLVATSTDLARLIGSGQRGPAVLALKERFERDEKAFLATVDRAIGTEEQLLAASREQVRGTIANSLVLSIGAAAVALSLALVGGIVVTLYIIRPLSALHRGFEQVGRGVLDTRLAVSADNEFGRLSSAFNWMVGELQSTKDEIVTANGYLDNVIRSMADALAVISPEGIVSSVNPAICTLLGYHEAQLVGQCFSAIVAEEALGCELLAEMIEREQLADREICYRSQEGDLIPVALSGAVMRNSWGEVQGVVCLAHDMRERKRVEAEIRDLAYSDQLTGLPNRALFQDRLGQALAHAHRDEAMVAILFLDLDRFKDVNDTMGHSNGDQLLAAVAERLKGSVRQTDTLARVGGDEFVIILSSVREERSASVVAQMVLDIMGAPFEIDGKEVFISTSIGIAVYPGDGADGDTLLRHADMALYAAKERGRNAFSFFSEQMNRKALERRSLEDSLRRAMANDEFYVDYQPQIDLRSGRLFGVEALLRWRHPEEGLISPARFIPVAEEMGLIRRLGEWVLRTACNQCHAWHEEGYSSIRVAVNVSGHQFNQPGFIEMVDEVLEETGLDPSSLELELTESTLMEGANETIMTLIDLKVRGIHLAIDDFGTGYSSLSYLKHFPIDRLKVDRSFIRDISTDLDDCAIVEAIIGMAHSLGRRVLAEGVERAEELEFLRARGCDEVQGYYFGRPMSPQEIEQRLVRVTAEPVAERRQAGASA
ncbi:diguanylate cyclase [Geotalea uraniireducens]|uniref:Diguanylate cyclase n=1 Tax=Geotalea uraniireducens TaxID=351604 RepID=A0ABM8EI06_9BACT|nr:diguanylate cyclase [Geotalea uraniireducens]